ncbi:hypothetical protein VTL71DRAFT_8986 [Oculimacula yallundae]|uniref:RING-type domain-containing protein n=1 Tax=Oculimacula yallundae TaxID=86028 RepID=A0ABR4BV49_9HELO
MADRPGGHGSRPERLDATGPRQVVFCHQCQHEWYQDESGLECPRCEGAFTEVVTAESDPRPPPLPDNYPGRYEQAVDNDSDPEEADISEIVTRGPGGSFIFQRTVTTGPRITTFGNPPRAGHRHDEQGNPDFIMRDFENVIGSLMGPGFRPGQAGRSGPNTLFPPNNAFGGQTFRLGGNGNGPIVGTRFTFGGPGSQPVDTPGARGAPPPVPDLATIIGALFAPAGTPAQGDGPHVHGLPPGLQGLFAAMTNPANARSGDAVYSQEALDQIISTLMEQHPTSNAPGPASPDAISALPKKKLDEKELGPEGKAECSVCMDDVTMGVEVVVLPCSHWFHETCASAWLSEHNTCPICRKSIDSETPPPNSRRSSQGSQSTRNEHRARSMSSGYSSRMGRFGSSSRNEARLESIRNNSQLPYGGHFEEEGYGHRRSPTEPFSTGTPGGNEDFNPPMPGAFQRRQSGMSENQRDSRRTNTSTSDQSRESRRGSQQSGSSNTGGGAMGWIRDRFGSGSGANRRSE